MKNGVWMGYGIGRGLEPTAVDVMPFLIKGDDLARSYGSENVVVIPELLAVKHNDVSLEIAEHIRNRKNDEYEIIIDVLDLKNTRVEGWSWISENPEYVDTLEQVKEVVRSNKKMAEYCMKGMPQRLRTNISLDNGVVSDEVIDTLGYMLEQIAATLTLHTLGYHHKVGHPLEDRPDNRALKIHRKLSSIHGDTDSDPNFHYLPGGYEIGETNKNRIIPPYLVPKPESRITLSDDKSEIRAKLNASSEMYRTWCSTWLGIDRTPNIEDLATVLYDRYVGPVNSRGGL